MCQRCCCFRKFFFFAGTHFIFCTAQELNGDGFKSERLDPLPSQQHVLWWSRVPDRRSHLFRLFVNKWQIEQHTQPQSLGIFCPCSRETSSRGLRTGALGAAQARARHTNSDGDSQRGRRPSRAGWTPPPPHPHWRRWRWRHGGGSEMLLLQDEWEDGPACARPPRGWCKYTQPPGGTIQAPGDFPWPFQSNGAPLKNKYKVVQVGREAAIQLSLWHDSVITTSTKKINVFWFSIKIRSSASLSLAALTIQAKAAQKCNFWGVCGGYLLRPLFYLFWFLLIFLRK